MKSFLAATRLTFSRELARHLAARLGESEAAVSRALLGMVPVVLCQVVIRTGEGRGAALAAVVEGVPAAARQAPPTTTELLGLLGSRAEEQGPWALGRQLLEEAFGQHLPALTDYLSTYARIRPHSAAALLQLVGAVMATGLARYRHQENVKPGELITKLAAAKKLAYGWLPADLQAWPGYCRREAVRAPHALWAAELGRPYWLLMLAAGVLMLLVIMFMSTGRDSARVQASAPKALVAGQWPGSQQ